MSAIAPSTRSRVKAIVERGLLRSPIATVARRRRRHGVLVLAYHDIVPLGAEIAGDRSLHLTRRSFAEQLDVLMETHDVVPLATVVESSQADRPMTRATGRGRPQAVITFDDAYQGAVTAGVPELVSRNLPATIFVAPAFVGGKSFWWDELADPQAGLDDDVRVRALDQLAGRDEAIRGWAGDTGRSVHVAPEYARCATEEELRAACRGSRLTLASHSWSHPNLARLGGDELRVELERPLAWLRERFEGVSPYLAYPYGLSSPAVARAAKEAGYRAGLLVAGGWLPDGARDHFALPRLNIPAGMSRDGFALRAAGLFCD
jgi:peptidoglycan/xylan/chitin deacetylase (PgdA/CDA1 family)